MMARSRFLFATNPLSRTEGAWKKEKPRAYKLLPSLLPSIHLFLFSFLLSIHLSYFSASFNPIFHLSLLSSIRLSLFSYFPLSACSVFPTPIYPPFSYSLLSSSPFHLSVLPFAFPNSLLPSIGLFLFPYFPQSTFPSFPIYFSLSAFPSFPPSLFPSTCLLFLSIDTSLNQTFTLSLILSTRLSYISPHMFDGSYTVYTHMDYIWECNFLYTWAPYGHGVRYVTLLTQL